MSLTNLTRIFSFLRYFDLVAAFFSFGSSVFLTGIFVLFVSSFSITGLSSTLVVLSIFSIKKKNVKKYLIYTINVIWIGE